MTTDSSPSSTQALAALQALAHPDKAIFLARYFKTGPGQYGEGDRFLGIVVPRVRQLARQFRTMPMADCKTLLESSFNEARLLALLIWVNQYVKGDLPTQDKIHLAYLANRQRVNNWNLVDSSAPHLLGEHVQRTQDRSVLYTLAQSDVLWDRRMAVLASFNLIRAHDFGDALRLIELLLADPQDLMHKACGWMLREVGKRAPDVLKGFLHTHQHHMPRTMLRYAIEHFSPEDRQAWRSGKPAHAT